MVKYKKADYKKLYIYIFLFSFKPQERIISNLAENIFDFLVKSNFEQGISVKFINTPSSKTFYLILNYLINLFDPNLLNYHVMNEETIPNLMKFLGYPLVISKSSFLSMTAPHTWTNFLHLLNWMVEFLRSRSSMELLKSKAWKTNWIRQYHLNKYLIFLVKGGSEREKTDVELIEEMIKSSFSLPEKERNEHMQGLRAR